MSKNHPARKDIPPNGVIIANNLMPDTEYK
jgi:hypothetical protein